MSTVEIVVIGPITWDTEQEDGSVPSQESLGLPKYETMYILSDQSPEDRDIEITDKLSDKYGYCILHYNE